MTRAVLLAVIVAQALDLLTWAAMPPAAEVNAIARGFHTPEAWLAKSGLCFGIIVLQSWINDESKRKPIRRRWRMPEWTVPEWIYAEVAGLMVGAAILAGALGAGSNMAAISWVSG